MDRLNRQAPVQTWNAIFFSQIAMHEQEGMVFLSQRNASPFGAHAFDVGRSRASHEQERVSNDLRLQLWAKALFSSLGGVPLR